MPRPKRDLEGELAAAREVGRALAARDAAGVWTQREREYLVDSGVLSYEEAFGQL